MAPSSSFPEPADRVPADRVPAETAPADTAPADTAPSPASASGADAHPPTPEPDPAPPSRLRWRVVDIVVASVLGVAVGVVFWVWSTAWSTLSLPFLAFPPAAGLLTGVWVLAGPLGAMIIRRPGAALYCEILAAAVSAVLGTQWGMQVLISGALQGLGAELVVLLLLYRRFGPVVTLLSGLGAGLFLGLGENLMYNTEWQPAWQLVYLAAAGVSGLVLAGGGTLLAVRALRRTGVLAPLASGRTAAEV